MAIGVLLVMQCLVTAESVKKCDNLHCGPWKNFGWFFRIIAKSNVFKKYVENLRDDYAI